MAATNNAHPDDSGASIEVWITPTIERDYRERNVFPELRIESAAKRIRGGTTGVFFLTLGEAEAIRQDALERTKRLDLPRGLPMAYGCLLRAISPAIKAARGDREDPGREAVAAEVANASSLFHKGDRVRYCSPWRNDKDDGVEMVITADFAFRVVSIDEGRPGAFITPQGRRVVYRWGYCAQRIDRSIEYFYSAGEIQTMDYKLGHLRLVKG